MSVKTAIIVLGSIFALSISGSFNSNILTDSRFLELFRGSCFHFLCLLLKSFPGSLSKHFHFLSWSLPLAVAVIGPVFTSVYTSDRIASSLGNIASCPAIQTFKDFGSNQVRYIHTNV